MSTRTPSVRGTAIVLAMLGLLLALVPQSAAAAKTVSAKLRVLTANRVLDPGTTYVVGQESIRTDPEADCNFGGAGGSGAVFDIPDPTGLGLLVAGAEARRSLSPLSVTDEFGFGIAVCAIGGVDDQAGSFWYFKRNHEELSVGVDQEKIANRDELVVYLAPDNFPAPNPAELELRAPARAKPGSAFDVSVLEHSCVTDGQTFETTCASRPAEGAVVRGTGQPVVTGSDGRAVIETTRSLKLSALRFGDIPSERLGVCVSDRLSECPSRRGERIVGSPDGERIKGTSGSDVIRARGGRDKIDLRTGGADRLNCGRGRDTVLVQRSDRDDKLKRNCERVRRR